MMADQMSSKLSGDLLISERRRRESQRLSGVGFWEIEHAVGSLYWSEEIFAIYNLSEQTTKPDYELWVSLIHDDDREFVKNNYETSVSSGKEYSIRYRVKSGNSLKWIEARGVTYYGRDGEPERTIGTAQDISEIMAAQEQVKHIAYHDMLTGLANRTLFSDKLNEALLAARRNKKKLAVLFIDLDDFKYVNDQYGHNIGDEVLVGVAKKLQSCARDGESFARIGGDEFAGLMFGKDDLEIEATVKYLQKTINTTYETQAHKFRITSSIGVAVYPQDNVDTDILLRHADQAMYEAKELGKAGVRYFDTKRFQSIALRQQLLTDVGAAIVGDQFELFYQPRIRLSDGRLAGAEALLRWFRPQGAVGPSEIVKAIKSTPAELALDTWVIKRALLNSKKFKEIGLEGPFSFNINPSSIENPNFPKLLKTLLSETGAKGEDIEIEILEVESLKDFDTTHEILSRCKELGVSFSLDDFGTGYSSLTHFHALPISKVKIDQRFIKSINSDPNSLLLVKSILAIARANNKPVVAEGVESDSIAQTLAQLGCQFGQGYGIAKPMPLDEYIKWTKRL